MVMTWRSFDHVLEVIADVLPGLESLAIHGLSISPSVFANFCSVCRESLTNLQLRSCGLDHLAVHMIFTLPALRRLDLSGTVLLLRQADLSFQPLGQWLQERGPQLQELVLAGVVVANDDEQRDEELLQWLQQATAWCELRCPKADRCKVVLTAVNEGHRLGMPIPVRSLQSPEHWSSQPRFSERVRPGTYFFQRRVDAGDAWGQWPHKG
ncbi:unnamed protein product [Polarella glacialis]|uniref:Uncharacterized protein n=1 Tax=Polarella glacialis TaxID=89957 RepID=A0A813KCP4_POLGL|nr:unnamed protein product [Polarella glacialis]